MKRINLPYLFLIFWQGYKLANGTALHYTAIEVLVFFISLYSSISFIKHPKISVVSIDGSIGAGKSTLFNKLRLLLSHFIGHEIFPDYSLSAPKYYFLDEPVSIWATIKNTDGKGILQMFYEDKKRYSYTFQNMAYITRADILLALIESLHHITSKNFWYKVLFNEYIIISERSILTDRYVFAQMLKDDGMMNQAEMQCYDKWHGILVRSVVLDKIVYVKTSVNVCMQRIHKRDRDGEKAGIDRQYLENLEKYHDAWLEHRDKVLKLDTSDEFEDNPELMKNHLNRIINFINS